jgi:hypothetical protein
LNATPGAVGAVAGALLPPGSAPFAAGVDCDGGVEAGACVRGATGGDVEDAGGGEGVVAGAEAGVVVHAAETRKTAVNAKRETRQWILKSGSLIMAASIPSDLL